MNWTNFFGGAEKLKRSADGKKANNFVVFTAKSNKVHKPVRSANSKTESLDIQALASLNRMSDSLRQQNHNSISTEFFKPKDPPFSNSTSDSSCDITSVEAVSPSVMSSQFFGRRTNGTSLAASSGTQLTTVFEETHETNNAEFVDRLRCENYFSNSHSSAGSITGNTLFSDANNLCRLGPEIQSHFRFENLNFGEPSCLFKENVTHEPRLNFPSQQPFAESRFHTQQIRKCFDKNEVNSIFTEFNSAGSGYNDGYLTESIHISNHKKYQRSNVFPSVPEFPFSSKSINDDDETLIPAEGSLRFMSQYIFIACNY